MMPLVQLVLTVASLAALAGGSWGVDRVIDRHARTPEQTIAAGESPAEEEEEGESKLLY